MNSDIGVAIATLSTMVRRLSADLALWIASRHPWGSFFSISQQTAICSHRNRLTGGISLSIAASKDCSVRWIGDGEVGCRLDGLEGGEGTGEGTNLGAGLR